MDMENMLNSAVITSFLSGMGCFALGWIVRHRSSSSSKRNPDTDTWSPHTVYQVSRDTWYTQKLGGAYQGGRIVEGYSYGGEFFLILAPVGEDAL